MKSLLGTRLLTKNSGNKYLISGDLKQKRVLFHNLQEYINYYGPKGRNRILDLIGKTAISSNTKEGFKIDDIDFDQEEITINSTFEKSDGTKISFKDYYKQKYGGEALNSNTIFVKNRSYNKRLQKEFIRWFPAQCVHIIPDTSMIANIAQEINKDKHVPSKVNINNITNVLKNQYCAKIRGKSYFDID